MKESLKVFLSSLVAWAKTPSGRHVLIAIAAALGTAIEQAIQAFVS